MVAETPRVLVVSAADSRFLPLLRGMMVSMGPVFDRPSTSFACFDIGLEASDRAWLTGRGYQVVPPRSHFGLDPVAYPAPLRSFLARPFLPEYFPGFDVYVWIDSDVWLQDAAVFDCYIAGARQAGMAVTHERERAYRLQPWLFGWTAKHFLKGYGPFTGPALLARRHLNAGFFAIAAGAPHWAAWGRRYEAAIRRSGALVPHDQFALVQAIYADRLETMILDSANNWICDRGVPMWNDAVEAFCKPYAPYAPIGAMHLAGPAKTSSYVIRRTGGGSFSSFLVHGASPKQPVASGPLGAAWPQSASSRTPLPVDAMQTVPS